MAKIFADNIEIKVQPYQLRQLRLYTNDVAYNVAKGVNDRDAKDVENFNKVLDYIEAIMKGTIPYVDVESTYKVVTNESNRSNNELHKVTFFVKMWPIEPAQFMLQRQAKGVLRASFRLLNDPQIRIDEEYTTSPVFSFTIDEVLPQHAQEICAQNKHIFLGHKVHPNKELKTVSKNDNEKKVMSLLSQRASRVKR